MAREPAVAVLDIGKSNAKLALADLVSGKVVAMRTMPNVVLRDGPYPHFDVERVWEWLLAGLAEFAAEAPIDHHACVRFRASQARRARAAGARLRARRPGSGARRL